MPGKTERTLDELYRDDPERADALVLGRMSAPDRRGFLRGSALAAIAAAVGGGPFMPIPPALAQGQAAAPKGPQYLTFPGKSDKLVVLGERPLVAETPEHLLDDDTTPTDKFFVRNNGQLPDPAKDPDAWKLTVDGEVNNKLELTLGELKAKFRPVTRRLVLECGGNGRSFFSPQARGNQWGNGGVGCAEWTGVRLADLLKAAGVKPSAVFTGHYGADRSLADGSKDALSRGVPIKKALDPNNLVVFGDERRAAAEHPRRPAAADHPGLAGLGVVEVGDPHLGARQGARRPGHGRHLVPGRGQADGPRRPGGPEQFPRPRIDAGALDHHQPDERHQLRQGRARREAARRRLGRRPDGAARRRLDRLRRELAAGAAFGAKEPVRLAALDRHREAAGRGLLRDLDAGDRFPRRHAAARGRQLEPAGLRRQLAAPRGDPRGVIMRLRLIIGSAIAALLLAPAPAVAQAQTFTPGDEKPEDYPAGPGRDDTFYACTPCHGFRIVAQQGQSRRQWDDTLDWMTQRHNMPKLEGDQRKVVLDYLEATYPPRTAPRGWQNPFQKK